MDLLYGTQSDKIYGIHQWLLLIFEVKQKSMDLLYGTQRNKIYGFHHWLYL